MTHERRRFLGDEARGKRGADSLLNIRTISGFALLYPTCHLQKDSRARGYRRYEVAGQGIGLRRDGMWWVMTVDDDYDVVDFVKAYQEFWKNEGSIYIEVLRSSAGKHVK